MKQLLARNALAVVLATAAFLLGRQASLSTPAAQEQETTRPQAHDEGPPGPEHQRLAKLEGEYGTSIRFDAGDGSPVHEGKGRATMRSLLGGRFLLIEENAEFFGQPFNTHKLFGYNNGIKLYECSWIYSGSTAMLTGSGTSKDGGRTIGLTAAYGQAPGDRQTVEILVQELEEGGLSIQLTTPAVAGKKRTCFETVFKARK